MRISSSHYGQEMKTTAKLLLITAPLILFAVISLPGSQRAAAQRAHIVILSTTDMHGRIFPIDYYTNKYDNVGHRQGGDANQGSSQERSRTCCCSIRATRSRALHSNTFITVATTHRPIPMMLAMNALRYDAMAVGNHEYNFGLKVVEKARSEANFPWLSANSYDKGTDKTHYQPYIVKEVQGVRVGILGLTTPGIPNWENPPNFEGLEFHETVSEAKKWVPMLRDKEKVDVVVIAMHMGIEEDLRTGQPNPSNVPNENAAVAIARQVPGVDVILMGHTHREVTDLYVNGVLLTQANRWASHVARVDLYLEKNESTGRWNVIARSRAHDSGHPIRLKSIRRLPSSVSLMTKRLRRGSAAQLASQRKN